MEEDRQRFGKNAFELVAADRVLRWQSVSCWALSLHPHPHPPHTHTHTDLFPHKLLLYCTDWWNTQLFQSDSVFRWLYLPHLITADVSCDQWMWAIVLNVLFRINQSSIPCYALVCEESKAAAVFFWFFMWNINFGDLIGWKDWVSHLSLEVEPSCV